MSRSNHTDLPALETERLLLRKLVPADAAAVFSLRSDERVNQFLDRPKMHSVEEAEKFIEKINLGIKNREWLYWAIDLKSSPSSLSGTACLWNFNGDRTVAELGYELLPGFHGKGMMHEAIRTLIDFAFDEIKLKTIKSLYE